MLSLSAKLDLKALSLAAIPDQIVIFLILIIIINLSDPSSYSFLSLEMKFMVFLQ